MDNTESHMENQYQLLTDFYEFSMANGYFLDGIHAKNAVFEYFFRNNPFNGGYAILAGVEHFLDYLSKFRFTDDDIEYLKSYESLSDDFLNYLSKMENKITVRGIEEGRIVFANEPILQVKGPLVQCQLIETFLLNSINFPTLCATKANRMWITSNKQSILEFGARRAQGPNGANIATYACMVGGCSGTSNVLAAKSLGIRALGTQAHSWIMSYPTEYQAFKRYVDIYPDSTTLLVDTYDTLKSGIPNAIKIGKELRKKGKSLKAIRLDSGNLAVLSREARKILDDAGFKDTKIIISNDVDEYFIQKFRENGGKADIWGIGTKLVTCYDDPALGGVFKMVKFDGEPKIKLAENPAKTNIPCEKKLIRIYKKRGTSESKHQKIILDIIFPKSQEVSDNTLLGTNLYDPYNDTEKIRLSLRKESYDSFEQMLKPLFMGNKRVNPKLDWSKARKNMESDIEKLGEDYLKLENSKKLNVFISDGIHKIRQNLIQEIKKQKK
ncbi:MAG: nicotinate phosphoribosyltransferase [Promethearchaeota archaeon]